MSRNVAVKIFTGSFVSGKVKVRCITWATRSITALHKVACPKKYSPTPQKISLR